MSSSQIFKNYFLVIAARKNKWPDFDASLKPKEDLLALISSGSYKAIAELIHNSDVNTLRQVVRVYYPETKARERSYIMAQVISVLFKNSEMKTSYSGTGRHPRVKVVNILTSLVALGEKLDWTKAAKFGFHIRPIKPKGSTKAVDFFTGNEATSIRKLLSTYGIKPAAYEKIFQNKAVLTDPAYSEKQRKIARRNGKTSRVMSGTIEKNLNKIVLSLTKMKDSLTRVTSKLATEEAIEDVENLINNFKSKPLTPKNSQKFNKSVEELIETLEDVPCQKAYKPKMVLHLNFLKTLINTGETARMISLKKLSGAKQKHLNMF